MGVIEIIAIILIVMWLGGFALNVGGNFIHLLLIIAVAIFLFRVIKAKL